MQGDETNVWAQDLRKISRLVASVNIQARPAARSPPFHEASVLQIISDRSAAVRRLICEVRWVCIGRIGCAASHSFWRIRALVKTVRWLKFSVLKRFNEIK